ncbi:MAG TPA: hypothetical protein VHT73_17705 [Thermodesulfobacteriota bacterium]|nr:hypothetical protein [Thermodesulfobacteriota bacterium]
MDNFDDYDGPSNYKGFDLTQVDEKDLSDVIERIDLIHQNLETIKELCKTLVSVYEPIQQNINKLKKSRAGCSSKNHGRSNKALRE